MKNTVRRCDRCGYIVELDDGLGRRLSQGSTIEKTNPNARCTCGGKLFDTEVVGM